MRQQVRNLALVVQRRQQPDLLAVRRIYINVALLSSISLPGVVITIVALITGVARLLSHHILWLGAEVSVAVLSIEMIFTTPQLNNIIVTRRQRNRVPPIEDPIEIGTVTTVQ